MKTWLITGGVDTDRVRQHVVRGFLSVCKNLGIHVIAEGIETSGERDFFLVHDVSLMRGYLFAKPAFKPLPPISNGAFRT